MFQKIKKICLKIILISFVFSTLIAPIQQASAAVVPVVDTAANTNLAANNHLTTAQLGKQIISVAKETSTAINSYIMMGLAKMENVKEWVLDGLFKALAQALIRKVTQDTVNWINNGFEGKPGFLSDPQGFLLDTLDEEIGRYLVDQQGLDWLCSPFSLEIRISLAKAHYNYTPPKCKLTDMVNNVQGFVNNNGGVGWDNFIQINQPSNNPYASYLKAESDMGMMIDVRLGKETKRLDWGQGFFSWDTCVEKEAPVCIDKEVESVKNTETTYGMYDNSLVVGPDGKITNDIVTNLEKKAKVANAKTAAQVGAPMATNCQNFSEPKCLKTQTNTPGSVIQTQMNNILPSGLKGLEVADEINEVLAALMNQVFSQVLTAGKGLLGMGQKGSDGKTAMDRFQEQGLLDDKTNENDILSTYNAEQTKISAGLNAQENSSNAAARSEYEKTIQSYRNSGVNIPYDESYYNSQVSTNLALNKTTTQSSTAGGGSSAYAVDGINLGTVNLNSQLTKTNVENGAWWAIDLGKSNQLDKIKIWRRLDVTPTESLGSFRIIVTSADNVEVWNSGVITAGNDTANPLVLSVLDASSTLDLLPGHVGLSVGGRYIKIQRVDTGSLQLAEVEVWGKPVQVMFKPKNNTSIDINKDPSAGVINSNFNSVASIFSNGQSSGIKIFVYLSQPDPSGSYSGTNYIPLNTLFSVLKMRVDKSDSSGNNQTNFVPEINPNLSNRIFQVADKLILNSASQYGLFLEGILRSVSEIPVGEYTLSKEIRDSDNNTLDIETTIFSVQ
jgi:hypothetical protein